MEYRAQQLADRHQRALERAQEHSPEVAPCSSPASSSPGTIREAHWLLKSWWRVP
jgi:hypothetical protein